MTERYRPLNLDFAVIGAQRAGSTFLASLIDDATCVDLPYLELPIFESPFAETASPSEISKAFGPANPSIMRGIKRPDLLGQPQLAGRLLDAGISRFIVSLRNPVDRLVSAVHWYMFVGLIDVQPAEIVLGDLLVSAQRGELTGRYADLVGYSLYGQHLEAWAGEVGAESILVVTNQRVRLDPTSIQIRALSFLGLAAEHGYSAPTASDLSRNANYYDQRRLRILRARLPFGVSWDTVDEFALNADGTSIRNSPQRRAAVLAVHGVDRCLAPFMKEAPFSLAPESRAAWSDFFAADVALLQQLRPDIDVGEW